MSKSWKIGISLVAVVAVLGAAVIAGLIVSDNHAKYEAQQRGKPQFLMQAMEKKKSTVSALVDVLKTGPSQEEHSMAAAQSLQMRSLAAPRTWCSSHPRTEKPT